MAGHRLRITHGARRNLQEIAKYTVKHWGGASREAYLESLEATMVRLTDHPELGRRRDDVASGLRAVPSMQHIIFYSVIGDEVIIVRILHQRMDAARLHGEE